MDILGLFDGLFASISAARSGAEFDETGDNKKTQKVSTQVEKTKQTTHDVLARGRLERMKAQRQESRMKKLQQRRDHQHKR